MSEANDTNPQRRIADLEARLAEALAKLSKAETVVADQAARIRRLGRGREETLLELAETRARLERALADRNRLQDDFDAVERMQTETIALPDPADDVPSSEPPALPSIDELLASLSWIDDGRETALTNAQRAEEPTSLDDSQIMLAPELMAPEEFAVLDTDAGSPGLESDVMLARSAPGAHAELVFLNGETPVRYPIRMPLMTIGRAEEADIRIDGDFISREHARIVAEGDQISIEDLGSKNGIEVNKKPARRQTLRHGDLITIGRLLFAFIDTR